MNTRIYNKIAKKEDKAKLIVKLLKYTYGKLNKKQLETIANNRNTKSTDYIKVITDAKEFAKEITLISDIMEHSWAGEQWKKEEAINIFGQCSFGEDYYYQYSNNGNDEIPKERKSEPLFNVEDTICVGKHINEFSNYNNNYYDEDKYLIIIYLGVKNAYKIDPEIQYILDNFNLEED